MASQQMFKIDIPNHYNHDPNILNQENPNYPSNQGHFYIKARGRIHDHPKDGN